MKSKPYIYSCLTTFFLIVTLAPLSLYAKDSSFIFNVYNDSFNHGITHNHDDWRSFELGYYYTLDDFGLNLEMSGFTNRSYADSTQRGRIDEYWLWGTYTFYPIRDPAFYLSLKPELGLSLYGDLWGELAQNSLHKIGGVRPIVLSYDEKGIKVTGSAGGEIAAAYNFLNSSTLNYLYLGAKLGGNYRLFYDYHLSGELFLRYERADNDHIEIKIGGQVAQDLSGFNTVRAVTAHEQGLSIKIEQSIGIFQNTWSVYYPSEFSMGSIGFNFSSKEEEGNTGNKFHNASLIFSQGFPVLSGGPNISWVLPLPQVLEGRFAMYTSINDASNNGLGVAYARYPLRHDGYAWFLGPELSLLPTQGELLFNPYISVGAGLRYESYVQEGIEYYLEKYISPGVMGEAGLRAYVHLPFQNDNKLYGLGAAYQFSMGLLQPTSPRILPALFKQYEHRFIVYFIVAADFSQ